MTTETDRLSTPVAVPTIIVHEVPPVAHNRVIEVPPTVLKASIYAVPDGQAGQQPAEGLAEWFNESANRVPDDPNRSGATQQYPEVHRSEPPRKSRFALPLGSLLLRGLRMATV